MIDQQLIKPFQRFLNALFLRLKEEDIPCFVARGGRFLPVRIDGKDLDIFVRSFDTPQAKRLLLECATREGLHLSHRHERSYFCAFWLSTPDDAAFLHIDLYPGMFTWKGIFYLSDDEAFQDVRFEAGFPFPSHGVEALSLLMTSFLWGGFVKEKYVSAIQMFLQEPATREFVARILKRTFGQDDELLRAVMAGSFEPNVIRKLTKSYRIGLAFRAISTRPVSSFCGVFSYLSKELLAWIQPPGLVVAILGPDGAGKSLLLKNLETLIGGYFGKTSVYHWRPSVLPDIGVLLKQRSKVHSGIVSDPHSKPAHGFISSLIRICYYLCDYHIGWIARVWPATARNNLILFDRYSEDMAVDPRRYRLGLPHWFLEFLCLWAPRPDLTIVLSASADVLLARKQEVSRVELEKTLARLNALARDRPEYQSVDCSLSSETVASNVCRSILTHLKDRRLP